MLQVTVKISGDKEEIAAIQKLGDKLTDFTQAMKIIGNDLKNYYGGQDGIPGQVFGSEGGILGERWASLSPVYQTWKGKHYPGKGILVASGELMSNFVATSDKNSVTITNPTKYFEYLQLGTRRMRARPMLRVNGDVEKIVGDAIDNDVREKVRSIIT